MSIKAKRSISVIEKSEYTEYLGNVYKDINEIKITEKDTLQELFNKFYAVMTKWGICQGNWTPNGRVVATPEWCICLNVFKQNINTYFDLNSMLSAPPKNLLAYGKKPKTKLKNINK